MKIIKFIKKIFHEIMLFGDLIAEGQLYGMTHCSKCGQKLPYIKFDNTGPR
jgi:hypothetical protein